MTGFFSVASILWDEYGVNPAEKKEAEYKHLFLQRAASPNRGLSFKEFEELMMDAAKNFGDHNIMTPAEMISKLIRGVNES